MTHDELLTTMIEQSKTEFYYLIKTGQYQEAQKRHPLVYSTHLAFGQVPKIENQLK